MKRMNKIFSGFLLTSLILVGCTNQDQVFDDYTTQSVYFPLQYPIRTIVLGEDRIDNSIDLQKAFDIGVTVAGMYENKLDRTVGFELAPSLLPDVALGLDTVYGKDLNNLESQLSILPTNYYSLVPDTKVVVPKGSLRGLIRVNLTDDFFNDPKAYSFNYVIPLRITNVSHNFQILTGKAANGTIVSPRWYVSADWATGYAPKDFTLFGVKFINVWQGTYFQRGVQKKDNVVDKVFHKQDITSDQNAKIQTVGLKKATYNRMGEKLGDAYKSLLTFSDDVNGVGDISVSAAPGTPYTITGTGKYYKSSTTMGYANGWIFNPIDGKLKGSLTLTLDYSVKGLAGATEYQFTDTLVFRSNDVRYEEFSIVLHPKK